LGFLVAPTLIFGALSFRSSKAVTTRLAVGGLGTAVLLGAISFAFSLLWTPGLTGFAVRNGGRTFTLALALLVCAWVFFQRVRATKSWAALVTGIACLGYGIDQIIYTGAQLGHVFNAIQSGAAGSQMALLSSATLMYADLALTSGICLGMVLLAVEEYQRSERELVESENRRLRTAELNTTLQAEIRRRHEIEQELRASEDRYRDLVEHSEDLLCTHDLDGRILSCNPAPARILGYQVHEILGASVRDFVAAEFRDRFDEYIRTVQRDGIVTGVVQVITRQGERRMWAFRNTLRSDGAGGPIVRGAAHDVTEQQRAERALRLSDEKFAVAFRASPCAMAIISTVDRRFIDVNTTFESHTGYSRAELVNRTSLELGLWMDNADRDALWLAVNQHGRLQDREIRYRHKNGRAGTYMFSAEIVQVGGERCILVGGVDITARKEAEARHQAILMALPDWVFLMSRGGVFLEFHARDQRYLVMPPREFIGRKLVDVLPPDLAARLLDCYQEALRSDHPVTLEYSIPIGDEERFYETRVVRSDQDRVLCLVRDVTDQRRAERRAAELQSELTHAGRVMALGTLTGSLAHEISQPLAAILTNAYAAQRLLDADAPDMAEIRSALGDIMSDDQRIAEVLRRLRGLLKRERRDYAPVDVNTIVDDVLMLARSSFIERRITIQVQRGADLPPVFGDRVQLEQVVLNILMNAADATTAAGQSDDRQVTVTTAVTDAQVSVSVADRGVGVTSVQLDQMFDPFFTTKDEGMGLGLSICRTIIDAHGGRISATRNPDRGLTCSFVIDAMAPVPNPTTVLTSRTLMAGTVDA
jgi:PAS domain S-box-containing protein